VLLDLGQAGRAGRGEGGEEGGEGEGLRRGLMMIRGGEGVNGYIVRAEDEGQLEMATYRR